MHKHTLGVQEVGDGHGMGAVGDVGRLEDLLGVARCAEAGHVLLLDLARLLLDVHVALGSVRSFRARLRQRRTSCWSSGTFFSGILCMPAAAQPADAAMTSADFMVSRLMEVLMDGRWAENGGEDDDERVGARRRQA